MRAMAAATIEALPDRSVAAVGRLTGMAYTLEHPELRQRVHEITVASYPTDVECTRAAADGAKPRTEFTLSPAADTGRRCRRRART